MGRPRCTRRDFLRASAGTGVGLLAANTFAEARPGTAGGPTIQTNSAEMAQPLHADVTIRIGTVLVELAPHRIISTVGYNGSVPAPVIRLREGRPVNVELINETDTSELVHWHGQFLPSEIDGAAEEKSRFVPAQGVIRYPLVPRPAGTRWVHTHVGAGADLHRSTYTGQFGFVLVEPANEPGRYDREVFLATHEWEPFFGAEEEEEEEGRKKVQTKEQEEKENGLEIGYRLFSINGKALGHGEPIRVKSGERVLFRILNASATENIQLALPGHEFEVVAMDGNPVPTPRKVRVLSLGVAERIDAIVEMNQPGVWILGTPMDDDRQRGMGIVVEYAGESGAPKWVAPARERWDYTLFGRSAPVPKPDEVIPMVIRKIPGGHNGFNHWTINGLTYDQSTPLPIHEGRRYRLAFHNQSDDLHPLHLHRHSFEMVNVGGKSSSGIMKDVVMIRPDERLEVDFVADNPGLTLFHCHQQLHMDYGFMRLFKYV